MLVLQHITEEGGFNPALSVTSAASSAREQSAQGGLVLL
jgi:hypothetical protein